MPRGRLLCPGCGPCRLHNPSQGRPRSPTSGFPATPGCAEPCDAVRCRRLPSEVRQSGPRRVQVGAVGRTPSRPRGHWPAAGRRVSRRARPASHPSVAALRGAQSVWRRRRRRRGARWGIGSWFFRGPSATDRRNWEMERRHPLGFLEVEGGLVVS